MTLSNRSLTAPSRIKSDIDWDRQGVQTTYLQIPHSNNDSPWGSIRMPVVIAQNGEGPCVLVVGGNHGDEYEGPVGIARSIQNLAIDQIQGRVIFVPALNFPAVRAATRISPIDNLNMNRIFPGNPRGSVSEMIADYVYQQFIKRADAVLDIHSGGRVMRFAPTTIIHNLPDAEQYRRSLDAALAFGAPFCTVLTELDSEGMLDTAVEALGKTFVSTELGGSGTSTPETLEIAERGIHNFLVHQGVVKAQPRPVVPSRVISNPDEGFVIAATEGLFDCRVELGAAVKKGTLLAVIHNLDRPWDEPVHYYAPIDGLLIHRHDAGLIRNGDCLAVLGSEAGVAPC